jgi:hypothetical protein
VFSHPNRPSFRPLRESFPPTDRPSVPKKSLRPVPGLVPCPFQPQALINTKPRTEGDSPAKWSKIRNRKKARRKKAHTLCFLPEIIDKYFKSLFLAIFESLSLINLSVDAGFVAIVVS